jgi:hypothetical protein
VKGSLPILTGILTSALFVAFGGLLLAEQRWTMGGVVLFLGLVRSAYLVTQWRQWRRRDDGGPPA